MKTWKKVLIGVGASLLLVIIVAVTVYQSRKNLVTVQTGKVQRESLASVVSASGEIKPKTYVNIGANAFGKIVKLHVKEGDHVKKGQLLAQLENVQSSADVNAMRASLQAAETDDIASAAALNTALADLNRAKSDQEHAKLDWDRAQGLYNAALIAKQDFDVKKAAWESAVAGREEADAKVAQARAEKDSADKHIAQNRANLTRVSDVLQKTLYVAPFDGIITNLPVREGETVVIGIQNSPGSTLMTIADMSVITSEVKVDETDIINVHLGQPAEVTIDAIPQKDFPWRGDRDRGQRDCAVDWCRYVRGDYDQRGSKRFQSGGDAYRSAVRFAARAFLNRQDNDGDAQQRAERSHPGIDGAQPSGLSAEESRKRGGGGGQQSSDRRMKTEGRSAGRFCDPQ